MDDDREKEILKILENLHNTDITEWLSMRKTVWEDFIKNTPNDKREVLYAELQRLCEDIKREIEKEKQY